MSRQENLYYLPDEVEIRDQDANETSLGWYAILLAHEIAGLESLGCNVTMHPNWVMTSKTEGAPNPFYNRVLSLCTSEEEFTGLLNILKAHNGRTAIVVNPFTLPKNSTELLSAFGAHHALSSVVLGKHLREPHHNSPATEAIIYGLNYSNDHGRPALELFAQFFAKNQETMEETEQRLLHNLQQGHHFLAIIQGEVVGLIGSVVFGNTASIYAAAISESHRSTNILDSLSWRLSNALYEQSVKFVYLKSRNRAAIGYARKLQGFDHLYNERVYEI